MNETLCNELPYGDNLYRIYCSPDQIIPFEYQGWVLLGLLCLGIFTTIYALYLMTGEKKWNQLKSGK